MERTLLIVDDEYWIRQKLAHQYDWPRFGVTRVLEAANGLEATEILARERVEIMLTDIDMPLMDGNSLIDWARLNAPGLFTLVLSGYSEFSMVRNAMVGGAVDYLLKPLQREQLYEVMERIVRLDGERRAAEAEKLRERAPDREGDDLSLMDAVRAYVDANYAEPLALSSLAEQFHISAPYLSRSFKKKTGQNLVSYVTEKRMRKARSLLQEGELSVAEVSFRVGYDDYAYFSNVFRRFYGVSPKKSQRRPDI